MKFQLAKQSKILRKTINFTPFSAQVKEFGINPSKLSGFVVFNYKPPVFHKKMFPGWLLSAARKSPVFRYYSLFSGILETINFNISGHIKLFTSYSEQLAIISVSCFLERQ